MIKERKYTHAQEKEHMREVASIGCIQCIWDGNEDVPCDVHHCGTGGGGRKNHFKTAGLCPPHHRWKETIIEGKNRDEIEAKLLAYVAEHCCCGVCRKERAL